MHARSVALMVWHNHETIITRVLIILSAPKRNDYLPQLDIISTPQKGADKN
jgi:hypothetical protein